MARDKENISYTILWMCIRILVNLILLFLLVQGFVAAYNFSYKLFIDIPYQTTSEQLVDVTIEEGNGVSDVAVLLEEKGVVENRYLFLARAYIGGYNDEIKVGTYTLGAAMSPDEICKKICGVQSEETS